MINEKLCLKCGNGIWNLDSEMHRLSNDNDICPVCGEKMETLANNPQLKNFLKKNRGFFGKKSVVQCVEEYTGCPISAELTKKRKEYSAKVEEYITSGQSRKDYIKSQPAVNEVPIHKPVVFVECPYCHSANCTKISGVHRWLSTGLFGIASSDIGKQWKCNGCGSKF